ncbi:MAG TPA: hypothetical protein VK735_18740 [Pseudonocardia sp.]|uniref:hypothetical protein n=1 Tax=Pseudonocardia sp. TaxID=60912 RepID=UPI002BD61385|nr:hypothetical protein [Pseudonocardia sp.]HTF49485.1 hypothetical protein [Pseudonocardia sp.]
MNPCGAALDQCRCTSPVPRTAAEIRAAHRASLARARRSGFVAAPVPGWVISVLLPGAWRDEAVA